MSRAVNAALALLLAAAPAAAQMDHGGHHDGSPSLEGVRGLHETVRGYLLASAEQASPELWDYRPTEEVRSFGEIVGHVANAGYAFCAAAMGTSPPPRENAEELGSQAEVVEALRGSFDYCEDAYRMDPERADEPVTLFGQEHTRLSALAFNMGHNYEHYGNLVTYMRINGMVPPSSRGGM
jgi:uncharacterized damage-inducible protein DinB